jgi:hypothetical protein
MTACLTASHGSEWPPPSAAAHNTAPPSPRSQLEEKRAAAKGTATALTCFIGAVQAGAIAAGLLVFTAKVDAIVNTASLPTGYTVRGGGGGSQPAGRRTQRDGRCNMGLELNPISAALVPTGGGVLAGPGVPGSNTGASAAPSPAPACPAAAAGLPDGSDCAHHHPGPDVPGDIHLLGELPGPGR